MLETLLRILSNLGYLLGRVLGRIVPSDSIEDIIFNIMEGYQDVRRIT